LNGIYVSMGKQCNGEENMITHTIANFPIPNWGYDSRDIFLYTNLEYAGQIKKGGRDIDTWFLRITCAWNDTPVVIYDNCVFYLSRAAKKEYSERSIYTLEDGRYWDERGDFDHLAFLGNFPHVTIDGKVHIYDLYGDMSGSREFLVTSDLL
jgi:hypothetical protein